MIGNALDCKSKDNGFNSHGNLISKLRGGWLSGLKRNPAKIFTSFVTSVRIRYLPFYRFPIKIKAFIKGIKWITSGNLKLGRYTLRKFLDKQSFDLKVPKRKTTFLEVAERLINQVN